MPNYWILKSEPSSYSFADLERDGRTVWDGVKNAQALIHIRAMKPGDLALFYHTGGEKAAVGLARITSAAYADPKSGDAKAAVVDLAFDRPLANPVTLAAVKAEPGLSMLGLVRQGRLSVVPVSQDHWSRLMGMSGES